ncbi:Uncharacterised protein [uncultured archaeon]|nr:Uncharacterised protein [uncultured archaeon]
MTNLIIVMTDVIRPPVSDTETFDHAYTNILETPEIKAVESIFKSKTPEESFRAALTLAAAFTQINENSRKNNLVFRQINAKLDRLQLLSEKIDTLNEQLSEITERLDAIEAAAPREHNSPELSERDMEVLDYVKSNKRVCAEDLQEKFEYKGRNAASARLHKLFRENKLEKVYSGRKVYYQIKE